MKKYGLLLSFCLIASSLATVGTALAYNPALNVYSSGSGDTTVSISGGQPNAAVVINYTPSGTNLATSISGQTDYSGNFTTMVNSAFGSQIYATVGGQQVYVNNNGYNGGCNYNCGSPYGLSLSQNSLNLTAGQSGTVTVYNNNNYSGSIYIASNSNPSAAGASVSGNTVYINAINSGNTNISVCQNSASQCATLYVTVNGNLSGSVTFNPSAVNLSVGQSSTVYISAAYYGTSLYISNNSNLGAVSANLSGSTLYLQGQAAGSSTIYVCQSNSVCGSLYVTVSGSSYNGGSNIYLSQYSLNLNVGQSAAINVSGNGGYGYFVSQNSNPGAVTASFNGSVLNLYAIRSGSSTIQICQNNSSSCPSLYVTVGSGYSYNGNGGLQYPGGGNVLGASIYPNGQLISEGSTVYIVYKNTKTAFSNSPAFLGLGFKFGNVIAVGSSGLVNSGYRVTTSFSQHPWGSWIKSGSTVYFVHDSGLIPLPDWATFINNGGQAGLIVPANFYDFQLPMLSVMTYNDSRLR